MSHSLTQMKCQQCRGRTSIAQGHGKWGLKAVPPAHLSDPVVLPSERLALSSRYRVGMSFHWKEDSSTPENIHLEKQFLKDIFF